jgi:hypothetical protein
MQAALALVAAAALAGCATYEESITNAQGQTVTCKASGKNGVITGYYLREGFQQCVDQAKAAGYMETQPAKSPVDSATPK